MEIMKINAGIDVGNGFLKGIILGKEDEKIKIASTSAIFTENDFIRAETESEIATAIDNLYDQMITSIASQSVSTSSKRIFGKRAILSGETCETFDVATYLSKSMQELSYSLLFSVLGATALRKFYNEDKKLPDNIIKKEVKLATALPTAEYKRYRDLYINALTKGTHVITFHNFEKPIMVELTFVEVKVISEGAAAQIAISNNPEIIVESGADEALKEATNFVGIDIGEGTVNFVVFQEEIFAPDISKSVNNGYGTFLDRANYKRLEKIGLSFADRKGLTSFLTTAPTAVNRKKFDTVKKLVDEEMEAFVNSIENDFRKIIASAGVANEIVYVYGGGSIPLREKLEPVLHKTSKFFGEFPIVYVDSKYAQNLNAEGLMLLAKQLFQ